MQLRYEIEHVRQCLMKSSNIFIYKHIYISMFNYCCKRHNLLFQLDLIESPVVTLNNSYTVQEIMDQLRKQIGVQFEEDETSP